MPVSIPEGFQVVEDQAPPPTANEVGYDKFTGGRTIVYLKEEWKRWEDKKEKGKERKQRAHLIANPEKPGSQRLLWGCMHLDMKLRGAREGELIFIRYCGMVKHPTDADRLVHSWEVARTKMPHPQEAAPVARGVTEDF